jgi:beta-lactamase regulating signal transducer with metallopeptidase domain
MENLTQFLPQEIIHAIGWTVLHSLWQALIVSALAGILLLTLRKKPSSYCYWVANLALFGVLIWAAITFCHLLSEQDSSALQTSFFNGSPYEKPSFKVALKSFFAGYFQMHLPLIVVLWLLGESIFTIRLFGGLYYLQRLQYSQLKPLGAEWQLKVERLSEGIQLKKTVQIAESLLARSPMVIGWMKPIILMPFGAINNLSVQQVEAVIAHELAHIKRNDYLLNLIQSVIETLFYFNPAVWWISSQIRTERENCCDDMAVSLVGNSLAYAKALASLQEIQHTAPAFALRFSKSKNQLLNRVQRILSQPQNKSSIMEKLSATFILMVAVWLLSANTSTSLKTAFDTKVAGVIVPPVSYDFNNSRLNDKVTLINVDTVPVEMKKELKTIIKKSNDEDVELSVVNGKIEKLKVNGRVIPEEEYAQYKHLLQELENVPPPPPAPSVNLEKVLPPPPPPPPALGIRGSRKIITERDKDRTIIIIENPGEKEPVKIVVKGGKKGSVIINEQEIKELKNGDKTIIIEKSQETPAYSSPRLFIPKEGHALRLRVAPRDEEVFKFRFDADSVNIRGEPRLFYFRNYEYLPRHAPEIIIDGRRLDHFRGMLRERRPYFEWKELGENNERHLELDREELLKMREELRQNLDKVLEERENIINEHMKKAEDYLKKVEELQRQKKEKMKQEIEIEKKKNTEKRSIN